MPLTDAEVCNLSKIRFREVKTGDKTERIPTVEFDEEALEQIDKLEEYEADYKKLVKQCQTLLEQARKNKVQIYWKIADLIQSFRSKYETIGLMKTLHSDLNIPQRTLSYFLRFRQEYETFDKTIPWAYYIELMNHLPKAHREEFHKRITKGEVKSRDDLRVQIKAYRKKKKITMK
jgi:hypothetical protein